MLGSKWFRLALMSVMLCATSAAFASSASAWTTSGATFTATAPAARFVINSAPAVALQCANVSVTGRLATLNASANTWLNDPAFGGAPLTFSFSNCSFAGLVATVSCAPTARIIGQAYAPWTATIGLHNVTCTVSIPALGCTFNMLGTGPAARAWNATWNNVMQQMTILAAGQSFTATWPATCMALFPAPGSALTTLTSAAGPPLVYTVTSGPPLPLIVNP